MTRRTVDVILRAREGDFVRAMKNAKRSVSELREDIDTTNDRTAWLAQSALALGPALTTVGAVAVPALAAMATQATVLAGAVGAGALAFSGMGDALKALNDYQLEPSAQNMEKLREQFDKMGPAGFEFVQFLDEITPQLKSIQFAAREGMFPGMEDGIEHLLDLLPQVRRIVSEISEGVGQLASEAGANLAGPGFADFFQFLEQDAKPVLVDLGRTIGNFAQGFTHLLADFSPTTRDFSSGLLDMSRSFEQWASSVGETQGFRDFLAYVEEATPKVLDLIAAFGEAGLEILQAAAPIGDVVVPALTDLLHVIAEVADTPIGTVMLGIAAAMSAYGRAAALASITTGGMTGKLLGLEAGFGKANIAALRGAKTLKEYNAAKSAFIGSATKAGLAAGVLAAQMTGVTDSFGLNNTAMGVMVGAIAGPWGAAIGGGIGMVMDFASAGDDLRESLERVDDQLAHGFQGIAPAKAELAGMRDELNKLIHTAGDESFGGTFDRMFSPQYTKELIQHFGDFSNMYQDEIDAMNAKTEEVFHMEEAIYRIGLAFGKTGKAMADWSDADYAETFARAQPAMDALHLSLQQIADMDWQGQEKAARAIQTWTKNAETASGRSRNFRAAIRGLDNELLSTADSADTLNSALEALINPQMNVVEATDAWTTAIRTLNGDLAKHNKTLKGNSNAAIQNRAAINDRVSAMMDVLSAEAEAGASADTLRRKLITQRDALIDAGKAAGISKGEMRDYLKTLGLTPKLVKTLVQAQTDGAMEKLHSLGAYIDSLDGKTATTYIRMVQTGLDNKRATIPKATGGYITGPGSGTSDSIPARLSNGEYVVKASSVRKYGVGLFESLNAQRFASGGLAGRPVVGGQGVGTAAYGVNMALFNQIMRTPVDDFGKRLMSSAKLLEKGFGKLVKLAEKEAEAQRKKLDAMKDELKALRDAKKALRDLVASNFLNDPFGDNDLMSGFKNGQLPSEFMDAVRAYNEANPMVTDPETGEAIQHSMTDEEMVQRFIDSLTPEQLGAWQAQMGLGIINQDAANAQAFNDALEKLTELGLSGDAFEALASSGNLGAAQFWAGMTPEDIAELMAAFEQRGDAALGLGQYASGQVYNADIKEQLREVREQTRVLHRSLEHLRDANRHLRQLENRMERVEKAAAERGPDRTAQGVASAINSAAAAANRGKR